MNEVPLYLGSQWSVRCLSVFFDLDSALLTHHKKAGVYQYIHTTDN